ncbi:MAG TPA: hypothetical protein VF773_01560 [Verrucomicrobiae bacterium]
MANSHSDRENSKLSEHPALLPARLDWPSAIGNFLLNFGSLEWLVSVYLKDRLPAGEFERLRDWHFRDRLTRVAQEFANRSYPAEQQAAFRELVERIESIRELRNHIAHGHMRLGVDSATNLRVVTLSKARDIDMADSPDA